MQRGTGFSEAGGLSRLTRSSRPAIVRPQFPFRVGVPKNERLLGELMSLLSQAALWRDPKKRKLFVDLPETGLSLILARAGEIAVSLADGSLACGFTGRDLIEEHAAAGEIEVVLPLGLGRCDLVFAVPTELRAEPMARWSGARVATSFPNLTRRFFAEHGLEAQIKAVTGGVEGKVATEEADAIVDLSETGTTLEANGLSVAQTILRTEIVFAARKEAVADPRVGLIAGRLRGVMKARELILIEYMIPRDRMAEAIRVAHGQRSPTISPIHGEPDLFAVRVIEPKDRENEIMDGLQKLGAEAIFSIQLHNSRF